MTKAEFLSELRRSLSGMPERDVARSLDYYAEMIDDRIEDGIPEEEAVAGLGDINECVAQIMSETPISRMVKEIKSKPKRKLHTWEIVLIAVGSPVWAPLLLAFVIVLLSLIFVAAVLVLSAFITLYAFVISFAAAFFAGIVSFFTHILAGAAVRALFMLGVGIASAGLAIISYICAAHFTSWAVRMCGRLFAAIFPKRKGAAK